MSQQTSAGQPTMNVVRRRTGRPGRYRAIAAGAVVALPGMAAVQARAGRTDEAGQPPTAQVPDSLRQAVGDALGITQQAELNAADAAPYNNFGYSVALSGSTAVVGGLGHDKGGAVYVFTESGGTWKQQGEIADPNANADDLFGVSVAMSGSIVVVGAPGLNASTGAAYVFTGSENSWTLQARFTAPNGTDGFTFGESVAVSGSTAVVGAPESDVNGNFDAGAAYVFTESGGSWAFTAQLTAPGAPMLYEFGTSVAVSGGTVVVGAPWQRFGAGAAYVFTGSGKTWPLQAELTARDFAASYLGWSVAVDGSTAVAGAIGNNFSAGAAYVFTESGGKWAEQAALVASPPVGNSWLGSSVAVSGSTVVAGAPGRNNLAGAAYVFIESGGKWSQQAALTPSGAAGDVFGSSVSVSGNTVLAGAPGRDTYTGVAYVFG